MNLYNVFRYKTLALEEYRHNMHSGKPVFRTDRLDISYDTKGVQNYSENIKRR